MKAITLILILFCAQFSLAQRNPFLASDSAQTASQSEPKKIEPPFWYPIVVWQKAINDMLATSLEELKEGFSLFKVLIIFVISLLYAVIHTAGPGHGKLILGTYFLTSDQKRKKSDAAVAGIIVSLTHIGMAFTLSLILYFFLNTLSMSSQRDMASLSRNVGGFFIMLTGILIIFITIFRNKIKLFTFKTTKDEKRMKNMSLYSIAVLSGIVPCPLAWFVLVFSISYGIYGYGILSIAGMAMGAAFTVGGIGWLVLVGREKALRLFRKETTERFAYNLRFLGGVILMIFGLIMFTT